jgi:hypothetical protein
VRRASVALALALVTAGLLPGRASAHVGVTAPAATSYVARITSLPPQIEAKVVDGDQRLWLRVSASLDVVVVGLRGEPYLRFSADGIDVNTRSVTFYLNRARAASLPSGLGSGTPPVWKRVTSAHSTSWHEDRLHALALAAHAPGARYLGRWSVPLLVDGRRESIVGGLWWAPRPSLLWFWPLVLLGACLPALLRLGDAGRRFEQMAGSLLAGLALAGATLGRLGRELFGRPSVSTGQLALVALTCVVAGGLALLWSRGEWRPVAGTLIGVVSLYQGLALVGTLRNAYVLAAIPAWAERTAASVSLAAGIGLLVVTVAGGIGARVRDEAPVKAKDVPLRGGG